MTQNMLTTGVSIEAKCTVREERKGQFCMERWERRKPVNITRSCGLICGFKDCSEMLTAAIAIKKLYLWSSLRWCLLTSFRFQWSRGNWRNKTQQYTNALSEGLVKVPQHYSGIRAKVLQTTTMYLLLGLGSSLSSQKVKKRNIVKTLKREIKQRMWLFLSLLDL